MENHLKQATQAREPVARGRPYGETRSRGRNDATGWT